MYTSLEDHGESSSSSSGNNSKLAPQVSFTKKALIFLGSVISIIAIVLILAFVLVKGSNENATPSLLSFTLASVFNSSLSPKSFNVQWGNNGKFFIFQNTSISGDWRIFNLSTASSSIYINATEIEAAIPNYSSYIMSPDGDYLLLAVNVSSVWRHSFVASYLIYTVASKTTESLVPGNPLLQNVVWGPANHSVAYVQENNIFIFNPVTATHTQVTSDGDSAGGILNGIQSWVYEEEVFSDFNSMWWSADGSLLAYLRFNESEVPIFYYTTYNSSAYPTEVPLRYPKAGYTNPQVELYVFDVTTNSTQLISTYAGGNIWEYVYTVQWQGNNLWVQQLNRYQNVSTTIVSSQQNGVWVNSTVATQTTDKWIDVSSFLFCQSSTTQYALTRLPSNDHYHIASFQNEAGVWKQTFLTAGDFDVTSISGCSPDGRVFYLSTEPGVQGATLQNIYTTTLAGTPATSRTRVGVRDGVWTTSFSPLGDYYVMRYAGPDVPQYYLVAADGSYNLTAEDNHQYAQTIAQYELPEKTFTTVKGAAGDELNVYFKKSKNAKQGSPLIIDVYAGPGTQDVRQVHDVAGLDAWLCSQGYIMASIDGRGTGGRGLSFMQATYRQLGLVESADQRVGAKNLAAAIPHVDQSRVGIWGWSFGGFMSLHGIANTAGIDGFTFKTAVSVAPVTDWRYYDSIYTERFMSTPADNPAGYAATSVNQRVSNIPDNTLLLMHGLADDNVHFQNSAEFVMAAIQADVQFDTMYYPNNNHAINTGNARPYLYQKMIDFLNNHL